MTHLLAHENLATLAQLASSKVLLAFDYDGTLAPIVGDRDQAEMRPRTAALLRQLCELYPCAVISGRSRQDVAARLGGAAVKYVIGNHGLEPSSGLEDYAHEIGQAHHLLNRQLEQEPGVDVENKRYSLALHYRRSLRRRSAREAIHRAIAALPMRVRVVPGKLVVNVVPEKAPHKGDALLRLQELEGADRCFYVGDDVTDEDVFALAQPERVVTLRIGESQDSAATYFLRDQQELDRLLAELVTLRRAHANAPGNPEPAG